LATLFLLLARALEVISARLARWRYRRDPR
jgi:hypothetical protein